MFKTWKLRWKIISIVIALLILAGISYFIVIMVSLLNPFPDSVRVDTIVIEKDEDFVDFGLPGSGTFQDPYRIENTQLGTHENLLMEQYKLIEIRNTSTHVVIQNCTLIGSEYGIYLESVKEGHITIVNNTFIGRSFQVWDMVFSGSNLIGVVESRNISIIENSFSGEITKAVDIHDSSNIRILGNIPKHEVLGRGICETDCIPFHIKNSSKLEIINNSFEMNTDQYSTLLGYFRLDNVDELCFEENQRVILDYSGVDTNIVNNTLVQCGVFGARIVFSFNLINYSNWNYFRISNSVISNNTIENSSHGLFLSHSSYVTIVSNVFRNCLDWGIKISPSGHNILIYHNSFLENKLNFWSQCLDDGDENLWYSSFILEGNFWSDLGGNSTYNLAGSASSVDLYPLTDPIVM